MMLLKTEGLATSNKEQEKTATCFSSHFPQNLGDEIFFNVMLWDTSPLFFLWHLEEIWWFIQEKGDISHTRSLHAIQTVGGYQV